MADLRTRLTLDGSDYQRGMNEAEQSTKQFSDASKMTASELLKQMKTMDNLGRSTSNYRQQLGQMTRQIQDLTVNYRAMSDEMKQSDFGKAVASQITELTKKASEMKDTIMDAQSSVKLLASDTANLDAGKQAIEGLSAGLQLVASAGILGADSTERLVKVMARLKAIEAATNSIIKIANILNKDSILMLKLKELATLADTKATTTNTAAQVANNAANQAGVAAKAENTAATVAQTTANSALGGKLAMVTKSFKGLGIALKSSKVAKFGVVGAVLALIAAYVKLSNKLREEHQEQLRNIRLTDEQRDAWKSCATEIQTSVGKVASEFDKLKRAYDNLETNEDKIEYLKKYGDEFKKLGIEINNINDLEGIWSEEGTKKIKTAVMLRAAYLAAQGQAIKKYEEVFNKISSNVAGRDSFNYKAGDIFGQTANNQRGWTSREKLDISGLVEGIDYTVLEEEYGKVIAKLTSSGAAKMKLAGADLGTEFGMAAAENAVQPIYDMLDAIERYAKNNDIELNIETNGGKGGDKTTTTPVPDYEEGSLKELQAQLQKLKTEYENNNLSIEEGAKNLEEQRKIEEKILEIENQRLRAQRELAGMPVLELIPTLKPITTQEAIKSLQEYYNEHPLEIPVNFNFIEVNKQISDTISGISSLNNALANTGRAIEDLGDGWDDSKSGLENITTKVGDLLTVMQSITGAIDTINTLTKITTGMDLVEWQLEKKKNAEKAKGLGLEMAETGTKGTNASLSVIEAIAGVIKSASEIPMVGWILGLGAVAAVIAAIASAPKFAKGGVVPGTSFSGDNVMAQVNSGEMILNTQQQHNLFNLLNNPNAANNSGGQVEFTIKGQDLKGVLRNYDTKISRI